MNLNDIKVYILPVEDTFDYIRTKYPDYEEDFVPYVDEVMTEEECQKIISNTFDKMANVMTLRQFQGEFNFALEDKEISSNKYFIKIF